jgi:hypothetical protein
VAYESRTKKVRPFARSRRSGAAKTKKGPRSQRRGKVGARSGIGRESAGTVGVVREQRPLIRLLEAFEAEEIRYVVIGMSAAIAQGVMANTLDVDIWIDLPSRQYMRIYLEDGTPVNFVYEVTGIGSFAKEQRFVKRVSIHGHQVPVLRLERILRSKRAVGRDKDKLHILHIRDFLKCRRTLKRRKRSS